MSSHDLNFNLPWALIIKDRNLQGLYILLQHPLLLPPPHHLSALLDLFLRSCWPPGLSLLLSTISTPLNALHHQDPLRTTLLHSTLLSSALPHSSIIQRCPMDAVLQVVGSADLL
jgi:hypothetical protein